MALQNDLNISWIYATLVWKGWFWDRFNSCFELTELKSISSNDTTNISANMWSIVFIIKRETREIRMIMIICREPLRVEKYWQLIKGQPGFEFNYLDEYSDGGRHQEKKLWERERDQIAQLRSSHPWNNNPSTIPRYMWELFTHTNQFFVPFIYNLLNRAIAIPRHQRFQIKHRNDFTFSLLACHVNSADGQEINRPSRQPIFHTLTIFGDKLIRINLIKDMWETQPYVEPISVEFRSVLDFLTSDNRGVPHTHAHNRANSQSISTFRIIVFERR